MQFQIHLREGGSFSVIAADFSEVREHLSEKDYIKTLVFHSHTGVKIAAINSGLVQFVERVPFFEIQGEIVWSAEKEMEKG